MNGDGQTSVPEARQGKQVPLRTSHPVQRWWTFLDLHFTSLRTAGSTSRLSRSEASVPPVSWRLSRIGNGARIEPSTPYGSRVWCSRCTYFKRSPSAEPP